MRWLACVLLAGCALSGRNDAAPRTDACAGTWSVDLPQGVPVHWTVKATNDGQNSTYEIAEAFEILWMNPQADGSCDVQLRVSPEQGQDAYFRLIAARGEVKAVKLPERFRDPASAPLPTEVHGTLTR